MIDKIGLEFWEIPRVLYKLFCVCLPMLFLWICARVIHNACFWIIKQCDKIIRWVENY